MMGIFKMGKIVVFSKFASCSADLEVIAKKN